VVYDEERSEEGSDGCIVTPRSCAIDSCVAIVLSALLLVGRSVTSIVATLKRSMKSVAMGHDTPRRFAPCALLVLFYALSLAPRTLVASLLAICCFSLLSLTVANSLSHATQRRYR